MDSTNLKPSSAAKGQESATPPGNLPPYAPTPSLTSPSLVASPNNRLSPPPAYESVVESGPSSHPQHTPAERESSSSPTILTINGKYICWSANSDSQPLYSLTHALDGHELSTNGILLTRIDQRTTQTTRGRTTTKTVKRDVFALRDSRPVLIGPANYEIDGRRFLSDRQGSMSKTITRSGSGWTAGGKGLPSFTLRPSGGSNISIGAGDEGCGGDKSGLQCYEWRQKTTDEVIAVETRRRWDKKKKTEISPPKLELIKPWNEFDRGYLDFLIAVWCMHNWREAKDITKEPLTWEEFKEQARTTASKRKSQGWNLGIGGFAAVAI